MRDIGGEKGNRARIVTRPRTESARADRPERGQVLPLVAIAILVMSAVAVVVTAVGGVLAERTLARTAADAAALAAGVGSDAQAAELARANGAELVSIRRIGDQVEVEVRVGRITARARAETVRTPVGAAPARATSEGAYVPTTGIP